MDAITLAIIAGVIVSSAITLLVYSRFAKLKMEIAAARIECDAEAHRIQDMRNHYEALLGQMKHEFKALSDDILREKREQFEREGLVGIRSFTEPLVQAVKDFRKRMDDINEQDIKRSEGLEKDIENLVSKTNEISAEADKLAEAIRSDAQVTGQWGEIQLKRILELGGLQETIDYEYQSTFTSPGANHADLRTDVLVKMPGDRWIVIDAKTTMAAYVDYVGAEGKRNSEAIERIIASIISHIKEMKTAEYHRKIGEVTGKSVLKTMLMFIPFEEVYLIAMKAEIGGTNGKIPLREWAWQNDVVFVNASGLIPIVRMLAELWARDRSEKKVLQIKQAAEALVEKFRVFLEGSKKNGFYAIGEGLATAINAFNESVKRLSDGNGSIIKKLTDLKEMGIGAVEKLPTEEQVGAKKI